MVVLTLALCWVEAGGGESVCRTAQCRYYIHRAQHEEPLSCSYSNGELIHCTFESDMDQLWGWELHSAMDANSSVT